MSIENNNSVEHRKDIVEITINEVQKEIHRGKRTVVEIKQAGNIPLNYALEQVIEGVLVPLDDSGSVVIKGGEIFVSHIKDGGSA